MFSGDKVRILYDSKKSEYKTPFGALKTNEECNISIKIPRTCFANRVYLRMFNENTDGTCEFLMNCNECTENYDIFSASFCLEKAGLYFYHFFICSKESDFELFRFGFRDTNIGEGEKWQLTVYPEDFSVPESFTGKVMYQIFPDRFFRENIIDTKDKLEPYYIHYDVSEGVVFLPDENGEVKNCDFYGGNFNGIIKKLDYIKSLGVSVIYLNPIFKAYSNHRYDTCDYKKTDPLLGDEKDFARLCSEAHKRDIKIILDGVFSHTGSKSIYFDKDMVFGDGAYKNPLSPYRDWYSFGDSDDDYESWWGIKTLPCVNEMNSDYLNYIINDSDSVIAHWMRLGADGYRLDVADELPGEFIRLLRQRVKKIKKDSYVVGEVWEDASNKISYGERRMYFSDSQLDSVMNYVFKNAIINFCTEKITANEFKNEIMTVCENYPACSLHSLMNSLSTHDTMRILSALSGRGDGLSKKEQAGYALNERDRYHSKNKLYIAMLLQYTLPGNACIYYGDEIGMEGFGDPFCRGYFKWDDVDFSILDFCKELGEIKNRYVALQKGGIRFTSYSDGILSFERIFGDEIICVAINIGYNELPTEKECFIMLHRSDKRNGKTYIMKNGFALYLNSNK